MAFSQTTRNALARVAAGETAYAAAKAEGLALSTVYNALKKVNSGEVDVKDDVLTAKTTIMNKVIASVNFTSEEIQRCQAAADQLKITRHKFMKNAVLEKIDTVLGSK